MKRLMTGISQDDQTSYRRLKENIEVILFLKIKKDLSEMLRIYEATRTINIGFQHETNAKYLAMRTQSELIM
ncbi:hypothetical protein RhiirA5_503303 [Rhizophagus irregularis]|uniref:Uncharacterized protein n=1 Tax=Rhizophagus irregularis TaxID=588596 RepID=A0A2N0PA07_9GLOM|nr:hypothetical protein RhiirA5_503303 [Rhizophagus irregularis]